ncbi:hypothetical protein ACVIJ1_005923 [Bradyrhizobium elkanii]
MGTLILSSHMAQYFFRISDGDYAGASDHATEFESRDVAWAEMTKVCGNFLGSISRNLKQNSEWHMELLDEGRKTRVQDSTGRRVRRLKAVFRDGRS